MQVHLLLCLGNLRPQGLHSVVSPGWIRSGPVFLRLSNTEYLEQPKLVEIILSWSKPADWISWLPIIQGWVVVVVLVLCVTVFSSSSNITQVFVELMSGDCSEVESNWTTNASFSWVKFYGKPGLGTVWHTVSLAGVNSRFGFQFSFVASDKTYSVKCHTTTNLSLILKNEYIT